MMNVAAVVLGALLLLVSNHPNPVRAFDSSSGSSISSLGSSANEFPREWLLSTPNPNPNPNHNPKRTADGPPPRYFTQSVDHFDGSNSDTWQQAYYVNDTFFKGAADSNAPVFVCVGGEGPPLDGSVVRSSVHCNVAVEWLQETGALMVALEHRKL